MKALVNMATDFQRTESCFNVEQVKMFQILKTINREPFCKSEQSQHITPNVHWLQKCLKTNTFIFNS